MTETTPRIEEAEAKSPAGILLFGFLGVLILYAFLKHALFEPWVHRYEGGDFTIYYVAAERMAAGNSPYPSAEIAAYQGEGASPIWGEYPYPPLLARLLVPLTAFPIFTAKYIYTLAMLTLFFGLMAFLARLHRSDLTRADFLPLWAVLLGWAPFLYSIRLGQCELLAMPFLALAWILLHRFEQDRHRNPSFEILAGLAIGAAAMVRLTPILMLPVFILAARWRISFAFVAGSLAALLLSGPSASLEFFTEVLPTMSDVSEMRHCPAFHVLILRTLDTAAEWTGSPQGWGIDRLASILGTGFFFAAILAMVHRCRVRLTTLDLFLLACFLPPLLAGKNPHHYALALFPILLGSLLVVRAALEAETPAPRLRMILWIILLLPAFHYWKPCNDLVDWLAEIGPFSRNTLFILGNLGAFLLFFRLLIHSKSPGPEKDREVPLQP